MTQIKHSIEDMSQPIFIPPLSKHSLHTTKEHLSLSKRHKISPKTSNSYVKPSQSLVKQALELADELSPLPDNWDYKSALADSIQQRHGDA